MQEPEHTVDAEPERKKRKAPPPAERRLQARMASNASWARTPKTEDRQARTAKARAAFDDRFAAMVDPDGTLTSEERAAAAANARSAHFARLALKSAQSRRRNAKSRPQGGGS